MSEQHRASGAVQDAASGTAEVQPGGNGDHQGKDTVAITVNDKEIEIHRGHRSVSEIKRLGGVPAADELAQAIEGQPLKPLADDGFVVLRGGEEFVSYPKDSSSSFAGAVG